jgi:hypothetical protein
MVERRPKEDVILRLMWELGDFPTVPFSWVLFATVTGEVVG